jgi:hypothetical protein
MLVLAYSMEEIYKIFEIFEEFLKSAKESYFKDKEGYHLLPLTEEGDTKLKSALEKFSAVYNSGTSGVKEKDFVYFLGQFLIVAVAKIDTLEMQMPKWEFDEIKKTVEELKQVWGGRHKMNGRQLYLRFEKDDQKEVIKALIPLLEKSAEVTQKLSPEVLAK